MGKFCKGRLLVPQRLSTHRKRQREWVLENLKDLNHREGRVWDFGEARIIG